MGDKIDRIVIAADSDKTLTPEYMQDCLWEHLGHDPQEFWDELTDYESEILFKMNSRMNKSLGIQRAGFNKELAYIQLMFEHIKTGCPRIKKEDYKSTREYKSAKSNSKWANISLQLMQEKGKEIEFFKGLCDRHNEERAISRYKKYVEELSIRHGHQVELEFHIISLGFFDMLLGSDIAPPKGHVRNSTDPYVNGIFANEFNTTPRKNKDGILEDMITGMAFPVTSTTKTRFIYNIVKGPDIGVNDYVSHDDRRVRLENIIYLGDGDTDAAAFALVRNKNGIAYIVHHPDKRRTKSKEKALAQLKHGRVHRMAAADYTEGSELDDYLLHDIKTKYINILNRSA